MKLTVKTLKIIILLVVVGFSIGIYLQDQQHEESSKHAWKANKYNLDKFNKITKFANKMNLANWQRMQDSIKGELDTLMILRFRKDLESLPDDHLDAKNNLRRISNNP